MTTLHKICLRCDLCGAESDSYETTAASDVRFETTLEGWISFKRQHGRAPGKRQYDLCPDCRSQAREIMVS